MATRKDKEWAASLANNRAGRALASHLASVELCDQSDGRDCAVSEAVSNERVFIYAIARAVYQCRPYPFGFCSTLPRFIAILNLSGERMLVHSDNPALIRCLCSRSSVLVPAELAEALRDFEEWGSVPSRDGGAQFVLLTYSLPWQSGTSAAFWHLSACGIEAVDEDCMEMRMADRLLQFSSASPGSCKGRSVLQPRDSKLSCYLPGAGALELVSDKQVDHFTESYSATCLDFAHPSVPSAKAGGDKEAQLLSMLHELQRKRKEDQEENKQINLMLETSKSMVTQLGEQMLEREQALDEKHTHAHNVQKELYESKLSLAQQKYAELIAQMESEGRSHKDSVARHKRAAKEHEARKAQVEEMERKSVAKDQLNNAALSNHVATISSLEGKLEKSREEAKAVRLELEKEHAVVTDKVQREHEEALAKATLALDSKRRIINQLSENNERRDVEVASLKTHEEEQERRIKDLEAQVHEGLKRAAATTQRPTRNRSSGPPKNASTSTHHCASTQTDKEAACEPEALAQTEEPESRGASSLPTYQAALDALQELVTASGEGRAPCASLQPQPQPQPMNGNARPLPFPHFTPSIPYHADPNGYAYGHPRPYPHPHPHPHLHPHQLQLQQRPVAGYVPPNFQSTGY